LSYIKSVAFKMLGRRTAYRLGRALYLYARGDIANDMRKNGEMIIQSCVLAAWKKSLGNQRNLIIFDVGANIGDWSTAVLEQLKDHGIEKDVLLFAFEPVPSTAAELRRNLRGNHPCLHIEELALSGSSGTAEIYLAGPTAGTNSLYRESAVVTQEVVKIDLISAADFCGARGIPHVHLLKCDTEGHDMEVIRGALPLLIDERISVLQFEYNHCWVFSRSFLRDVFLAIDSLPYKVAKLQANHVLVFDKWHPELDKFFEGNYALIHAGALPWFTVRQAAFDKFNTLSVKIIR
ncbi:MAG: FkbM family methyltransferase, partial [Bacteroidota bacterium]